MKACWLAFTCIVLTTVVLLSGATTTRAASASFSITPKSVSPYYDTTGTVDVDASNEAGSETFAYSYAHVSGVANQTRYAHASISDGNTLGCSIFGATQPDFIYSFAGTQAGGVWVANHYSDTATVYLASHWCLVGLYTTFTGNHDVQDTASIVRESLSDSAAASYSTSDEALGATSITFIYDVYTSSTASTDRPELEVYSEAGYSSAILVVEAWDDFYGLYGTPDFIESYTAG